MGYCKQVQEVIEQIKVLLTYDQTKCTLKLFINMALLTANEMYLKHLFMAARECNGMNDTPLSYHSCTKCDSLIDPEFYLLLITTTGTTSSVSCGVSC